MTGMFPSQAHITRDGEIIRMTTRTTVIELDRNQALVLAQALIVRVGEIDRERQREAVRAKRLAQAIDKIERGEDHRGETG
jgi:hypothetical protein